MQGQCNLLSLDTFKDEVDIDFLRQVRKIVLVFKLQSQNENQSLRLNERNSESDIETRREFFVLDLRLRGETLSGIKTISRFTNFNLN